MDKDPGLSRHTEIGKGTTYRGCVLKFPQCEESRRWWSTQVWLSVGQRQNIFSPGIAANFALTAQGTVWTANSH